MNNEMEQVANAGADVGIVGEVVNPAGENISVAGQGEPPAETQEAQEIMTIENMIDGSFRDLGKLKEDLKLNQHAITDGLKNDAKYRELDEKAKAARREAANYKKAFMKDPAMAEAQKKVEAIKSDISDTKQAISDYTSEYHRRTGLKQVEIQGELFDIVTMTKLVKK